MVRGKQTPEATAQLTDIIIRNMSKLLANRKSWKNEIVWSTIFSSLFWSSPDLIWLTSFFIFLCVPPPVIDTGLSTDLLLIWSIFCRHSKFDSNSEFSESNRYTDNYQNAHSQIFVTVEHTTLSVTVRWLNYFSYESKSQLNLISIECITSTCFAINYLRNLRNTVTID